MANLPPKIGMTPKTSNRIAIGAIVNTIPAYFFIELHAFVAFPSVKLVQSATFVPIASYSTKATKKNRMDMTIPKTPAPIGMVLG